MNQELFPSLTTVVPPLLVVKKERKPRKPRDPNVPKKPRKLSTSQQIIIKHVEGMQHNHNPADWGREGKICATLSKKYGAEFLLWVEPLEGHRVNSLTFYYSVLGRNHLSDQLLEFSKQKNPVIQQETKEISIAGPKIGEDISSEFKPKTLKDFLNYGKEIAAARGNSGPESSHQEPTQGTLGQELNRPL